VNFAAGDERHLRVEQRGQRAKDPALGLTAQAKQDEIVPGKNGIDDLGHHRVFVPYDPGKHRPVAALAQSEYKVVTQFIFDAARAQAIFGEGTTAQFAQGARKTHERNPHTTFPDYTREEASVAVNSRHQSRDYFRNEEVCGVLFLIRVTAYGPLAVIVFA